MTGTDFGVSLSGYYDVAGLVDIAQRVEAMGFDSLWFTENVYPGVTALETLTALAVVAANTKRVRLGPAVLIMPLRSPAGLAHATVTLDRLSGGRFILGVGAGGESKGTFDAYGVPIEERGRRCDEMLEIMHRLWTEDTMTHRGRFWTFENYGIGARPVQQPRPPIWLAGARAETVVKRAGKWADGIFPTRLSPADLSGVYQRVVAAGEANGRDMSRFTKAIYLRLCLGPDQATAQRICRGVLEDRYQAPVRVGDASDDDAQGSHFLKFSNHELVGPPQFCIENVQQYVAAGAAYVVVDTCCPTEDIPAQLATFAEQVMPHFK
jgi:alkanesulfonate monooxygenase SsuD/methylene tetrahydromethanopterin reductase-like flavin-dependent oxidoreductase (luciferase family)